MLILACDPTESYRVLNIILSEFPAERVHVQPRPIFGAQHWMATWRRQKASGIEGPGIHEAFGGEFSDDPAALRGINRRYLDDIEQDLLAGLFTTVQP